MNEDVKQQLIEELNLMEEFRELYEKEGNFKRAEFFDGRLDGILYVISRMGLFAFRGDDDRFESIC